MQEVQSRGREIAELPPWDKIIRGTLMRYRLTCGNKGCRCHRAKRWRHGPYWYVAVSYGNRKKRQRLILIPSVKAAEAKAAILAYQRLWNGLVRISDINLALLKAGKNTPSNPRAKAKGRPSDYKPLKSKVGRFAHGPK